MWHKLVARQLFGHLLLKGYKKHFLIFFIRNISKLDRKNLIEYKTKDKESILNSAPAERRKRQWRTSRGSNYLWLYNCGLW